MNVIVYDCEIVRAIPDKKNPRVPDIEYCCGWNDHAGMGISVVGCYDYHNDTYRVFLEDNLHELKSLVELRDPVMVGFNGLNFDNKLLVANGINVLEHRCYDILIEMWRAAGLGPQFRYPSHIGFGLDATAAANLSMQKTGDGGAMAPINWQRGKRGSVIDYCLNDVRMTKGLYDLILFQKPIVDPRDPFNVLKVRHPYEIFGG